MFAGAVLTIVLAACGDSSSPSAASPPAPSPQDPEPTALSTEVVPTVTEGPITITFLDADPPPGTTLSGCGEAVAGCQGRIRARVRVETATSGFVVDVSAALFGTESPIACLNSRNVAGNFELRTGEPRVFEFVFDGSDGCPTPEKIRAMNVIVSGDVNASGRQGWLIEYGLEP